MPSKPRTSTHWAAVTSAIAQRTGLTFWQAKTVYDRLQAKRESPLTVGVIRNARKTQVRAWKGIPKRIEARAKEAKRRIEDARDEARRRGLDRLREKREAERRAATPTPRRKITLLPPPPPPPKPEPAPLPARKPRTRLERYLAEYGAPFLQQGPILSVLNRLWRDEKAQRFIAKTLAKMHREISKNGRVSDTTKAKYSAFLQRLLKENPDLRALFDGLYFGIMKQMYR